MTKNLVSPWNPLTPLNITPVDFEKLVFEWIKSGGATLPDFKAEHLKHLSGSGGDYEFDAVARFSVFGGADVTVLIECKRYSRPVEREKLLALWAKMQDVKANKGMIFSTSGFQTGALQYASEYGISTLTLVDDSFTYHTRSAGPETNYHITEFKPQSVGFIDLKQNDNIINSSFFKFADNRAIKEWFEKTF